MVDMSHDMLGALFLFYYHPAKFVGLASCDNENECDKACDVGEYLDYENCKCRKKLVDKLVDEYTETIKTS